MKLTSKFLLVLLFTIFATLECSNSNSNIHKMFSQLNTGEINKGDIVRYYKANYDPMLELHNNFFDKCIDHLTDQEMKKNNSFFANLVEKVKDIFTHGTSYDKLYFGELGITIECENYINQTVSDKYISKKKEELKKLRSSLITIIPGNVVRPMGRLRSENGSEDATSDALRAALQQAKVSQSKIDTVMQQYDEKASAKGGNNDKKVISPNVAKKGGNGTGRQMNASENTSTSQNISTGSTTTNLSISGGQSNASATQTVTYDANGKKITVGGNTNSNGNASYNVQDKKYSGSTTSGMGAKFSIFYDRKITTKEGKSYVEIGGVQHLIDEDGWIHGLNIDSSDKKINYNIAYENYFDTSCESMLTFMKNKYTQLLADFNNNKDYVHNLQIENRKYIVKFETCTKENTEIHLKLNTCEQKIQGEKVKKSTLYHNIKDIKRIKVDTRIKEMQITINKLETTINNYKIEITNLKQIIISTKKTCKGDTDRCLKDNEEKCRKKVLDIETKCKIDIDINIKKYTQCESKVIQINIDLNKCREKNKFFENSECSKKLESCKNELRLTLLKNTSNNTIILKLNVEIGKWKLQVESYKNTIIILQKKIKNCDGWKVNWDKCTGDYKKCEEEKTTIIKKYETTNITNNITIESCKKDQLEWDSSKLLLIQCKSDYRDLKIKLEAQCSTEKITIERTCTDEKTVLNKEIAKLKIEIQNINIQITNCNSKFVTSEKERETCVKNLEINIKVVKDECEKTISEKDEKCKKDIDYQISLWKQCEDEKKKIEEQKDKECNESKEACNKERSKLEINIETITKEKLTIEGEWEECKRKSKDRESSCNDSERNYADLKVKFELWEKNSNLIKINCQQQTLLIEQNWNTCKSEKDREIAKWETCQKKNVELKVLIENKVTIINKVTTECQGKIDKKIIDIREEEKQECIKKTNIEINHFRVCKSEQQTIINQVNTCKADLAIYIKFKGFDEKLARCNLDLDDSNKKVTKYQLDINVQIALVKQLRTDITTITTKYEKCVKDKNSDLLKVDLDTCRKLKTEKVTLIKQLKIFIDKSFLEFRMTIAEMKLSYNTRIQKLLTIISSTKSQQTTTKVIIESHTTKIDSNIIDRDNYEKSILDLKAKITLLIKQRTEYLLKLDTIDSTSITLITEIKKNIIETQTMIDTNQNSIREFEILLRQVIIEISKYQGEIDVYKQNIENYIEMMEKYEEIKNSLEEYIKKLEAIIKGGSTISGENGTTVDISVYIKNIDTQDKDIIYKLNNQIELFEVKIKNINKRYEEEFKNFQLLLKKCEDSCNSKISIIQQEKNEMDEKCDKKISSRINEINKSHQVTILEIRANCRKEIIELRRKCGDHPRLEIDDNTYNFELYKRHCLVLIEKNTQDDCRSIGEIRTYYNEKCIMTSLPGSTKDLTTFASSDFTDDRNAKMMIRLNSKK